MDELVSCGRIERDEKETSRGATQAQQLLIQGWAQKCEELMTGVFRVPSASTENTFWVVDLARGTCTCPAASQQGMCKHFHVAQNVASLKGQDVESLRFSIAERLFSENMYIIDGEDICVFDDNGDVSTVISRQKCTCIAASFGLYCICKHLVSLVSGNDGIASAEQEILDSGFDRAPQEECSRDASIIDIAKVKLGELQALLTSENIKTHPRQKEILSQINQLHSVAFSTSFRRVCRKKKIEVNSSYRRAVERAKRIKRLRDQHDHGYHSVRKNKSKVNRDGSFRKQARKVQGSRPSLL